MIVFEKQLLKAFHNSVNLWVLEWKSPDHLLCDYVCVHYTCTYAYMDR